jgi:hypothetical protein
LNIVFFSRRVQEAAAKQAAWEQEQARIARERHTREMEEFKASEALAGAYEQLPAVLFCNNIPAL